MVHRAVLGALFLVVAVDATNIKCGTSFVSCDGENFSKRQSDDASSNIARVSLSRSVVERATQSALDDVNRLFNSTERTIDARGIRERETSAKLWSAYRSSNNEYAKDVSYAALVSIGASKQLIDQNRLSVAQIVFGLPRTPLQQTALEPVCRSTTRNDDCLPTTFRTISGQCNNVQQPGAGSSYEPLQRYLSPNYADLVQSPRVARSGNPLPNARTVSSTFFQLTAAAHRQCSVMMPLWGQFVFNDIVHLPQYVGHNGVPIACCDSRLSHPECWPIDIESGDPTFFNNKKCISYVRTMPATKEDCSLGSREQMNQATSYLDGSGVYGNTADKAEELRSFRDGKLKVTDVPNGKDLLPQSPFDSSNCHTPSDQSCFNTGSAHGNFLPTLTAMHTLWVRQHNRLCDQLSAVNGHWDDQRLYEEARRIVGAQIQHITYKEFIPSLIGYQKSTEYDLELLNNGFYSDYNIDIDASVMNVYAAAVGQFFYAMMPENVAFEKKESGSSRGPSDSKPLQDLFYNPSSLYFRGRLDSLVRHMFRSSPNQYGLHMTQSLRNRMFSDASQQDPGVDMAAMIVQMGRDHGLPAYVEWREQCGFPRPTEWEDLNNLVSDSTIVERLRRVYDHIDDVDLFVLGLAEKPLRGAVVGETFACLLGKQFQKLRRGDRFWYENFLYPSAMREEQVNEIRKTTLARIICDNTDDIGKVQPFTMMVDNKYENCAIGCNNTVIDTLNMRAWMDTEPKLVLPINRETLLLAAEIGKRRVLSDTQLLTLGDPSNTDVKPGTVAFSKSGSLSAKREAIDISKKGALLLEMTRVLVQGDDIPRNAIGDLDQATLLQLLPQVDTDEVIAGLTAEESVDTCFPRSLPCDHTSPFRTYSGWCNNLNFPQYGSTFQSFRRLLDPAYDDGFNLPRQTAHNSRNALPSARAVSNSVHAVKTSVARHVKYTHMVMQFGQFVDHDMTFAPVTSDGRGNSLDCHACDSKETVNEACFPIEIPSDDPHFPARLPNGQRRCIPMTRSLVGQLKLGYRQQMNQLTSYLDASHIYGSTECEANALRLFQEGKLNFTDTAGSLRHGLPQGNQEADCRASHRQHKCFNAGDHRSNEQPGLTAMHTIWLREHNRIATFLHRTNNRWSDERIFQETRRIVSAEFQHIVYSEFLPKVLGCEFVAKYDLVPKKTGYYTGYDERCDATISNEFSASAFRFGHTLIRDEFPRVDDFFKNYTKPMMLKDHFMDPSTMHDDLTKTGGIDTLLMGLVASQCESYDRHIVSAVRDELFSIRGTPKSGMDLAAINIQRARDHGIKPYNDYRELCGQGRANSFNDLRNNMDEDAINSLRNVYDHVNDIDLFPGMMAERPMEGALVGPTTACLLAEQFQRAKRCDRFYYENDNAETRFTPDQLAEIRKITLGKIVCQNNQFMRKSQPRVFDMPDELLNAEMPCQELPTVDLNEWFDRNFCVVDHRVIQRGRSRRMTPCVSCTCTNEGPECHTVRVANCENLLKDYLLADIVKDTVCVIQCSSLLKTRV